LSAGLVSKQYGNLYGDDILGRTQSPCRSPIEPAQARVTGVTFDADGLIAPDRVGALDARRHGEAIVTSDPDDPRQRDPKARSMVV
jgi:hypothetical protein